MPFEIRPKHIKRYPHFDAPVVAKELQALATNPAQVARHAFLPLIQYTKRHQPFRKTPAKPQPKERLIRYAARTDSAIFASYRYQLAQRYEEHLHQAGIADVPIAYRKIPVPGHEGRGKCSIDFAADVIEEIVRLENCVVVTLDISQYFENIEHARIYRIWCRLLGVPKLPPDHLAVFKRITRYVVVDRAELYARLGFSVPIPTRDGSTRHRFRLAYREMPKQLCSPRDFRKKVMGGDPAYPSLARANPEPYGIPQGAPISDLLANINLLDFDIELSDYARQRGGRFWRYSDDLILVLPGDAEIGKAARDFVVEHIGLHGDKLKIKAAKTCIGEFGKCDVGLRYTHVAGAQGKNGLEYLGFRFDGQRVYLRDGTMANFYRKLTRNARAQARNHVARYAGKSRDELVRSFNYDRFERRFGRVRDFDALAGHGQWTFWTYARRAAERMGPRGHHILRQVAGYRGKYRQIFCAELEEQLERTRTRDALSASVTGDTGNTGD